MLGRKEPGLMLGRVRSLQLVLDLQCNNNCTICGASWPFQPHLNTVQAIDRLQRGIEMGLSEVVLSGGEVTLRRDLLTLIQTAREIGYTSVILLTNGRRLAHPAFLQSLLRAGITGIGSSLHGHTPEVHEQITQAPRSFWQAVEGIQAVRHYLPDLPLSVNYVLSMGNYRYTTEVVRLLVGLDVRMIQITYVVPVGRARGIFYQPDMPRMIDTLPFIRDGIDIFLNRYHETPNATIVLAFFPFCVLSGLESFSGDIAQPITYFASEVGNLVAIEEEIARQHLKTKRSECALCRFSAFCDGIWQEYVAARGWAEFTPITEYGPDQAMRASTLTPPFQSETKKGDSRL